ncbi:MAG: TAT-variant-translocated molybdopterin oxidoreductase [Planctomycetota bacterium]
MLDLPPMTTLDTTPATDSTPPAGETYWRSLDELAATPEFREALQHEFADYDPDEIQGMSRRSFVKLMAASMALSGVTFAGCRRLPEERMAPFAARPEGWVPGTTIRYASMDEIGGVAVPTLVQAYDGRPIKVDGRDMGSSAYLQARVLEMYDPERARWVYQGDAAGNVARSDWAAFAADLDARLSASGDGSGVGVLTQFTSSPTAARLREAIATKYPGLRMYAYEPIHRDNAVAGSALAFGRPLRQQLDLSKAEIIACFDDDLLGVHPNGPTHARQWAERRRGVDDATPTMNRVYAAESTMTLTGSVADERLPVQSGQVSAVLMVLARRLGVPGVGSATLPPAIDARGGGLLIDPQSFVAKLADDLEANRGKAVVTVGFNQPPAVHALAHAINQYLGNDAADAPVSFIDEFAPHSAMEDIHRLAADLDAGDLSTLLILGGNPCYDAPADLDFAGLLGRVESVAYLSLYATETSLAADWQLPMAHALTQWGDGRGWDGTTYLRQPQIEPLYAGRSDIELLGMIAGETPGDGYALTRATFAHDNAIDEPAWRKALSDGELADTAAATVAASITPDAGSHAAVYRQPNGFELTFQTSRQVYDGRFANNAWLQEVPEPLTKMTWGNAALINIHDADELGVKTGDVVRVTVNRNDVDLPVYPMPGQARGSIAVALGFGRQRVARDRGNVGHDVGVNVYPLRTRSYGSVVPDVKPVKLSKREQLAMTQNHYLMDQTGMSGRQQRTGTLSPDNELYGGDGNFSGRIIKDADLAYFKKNPEFVDKGDHFGAIPLQLWEPPGPTTNPINPMTNEPWPKPEDPDRKGAPEAFTDPHAWGMSVDMSTCLGCSACIVACQAENNIPVVGKEQVLRSREMHWLRNDRYFKTDPAKDPHAENPKVAWQPVSCVQCENAPCEQVCPVAATVHDTEGLNTMVYNRCIGTRYCANNCPYKVRRFNYFDYHSKSPTVNAVPGVPDIQALPWLQFPDTEQRTVVNEITRMMFNPEVTVRMRGVMEKCTYCTQRIAAAKIHAKNEYTRTHLTGVNTTDEARDTPLVKDGEVTTACQDACSTGAIVFGDLNDADSKVSQLARKNRSYGLLTEFNTRPRTKYLAIVRNPKQEA